MKLSDGTKSLIFIIVGLVAAAASYFLVIKGNIEDTSNITVEVEALNRQYADLVSKQANRQQYIDDTEKFQGEYDDILAKFPATLNQENTIVFVKEIQEKQEVLIDQVKMGIPEQYYVLGAGVTGIDGAIAEGTEETIVDNNSYVAYKASFPIDYYFVDNFDGLKEFMDYVINYKYRASIDSMKITYNADDKEYKGDFVITFYAVYGDRPDLDVKEFEDIKVGVDNLFSPGGSGQSTGSKLSLFDENSGAAIETEYNYFVRINPTTSDIAGKLVGMGGTNKAGNDISSDENKSEKITFEFVESGDKRYLTYSIGDESKEVEVTSADYATILIQSSDIKDDADKNAAVITINNAMGIPVYVKVVGDDTASRVKISKSGSVKVYQ